MFSFAQESILIPVQLHVPIAHAPDIADPPNSSSSENGSVIDISPSLSNATDSIGASFVDPLGAGSSTHDSVGRST